jgi:hypothetical protein
MLQPDYPPAKAGSKTTRPHGSAGIIIESCKPISGKPGNGFCFIEHLLKCPFFASNLVLDLPDTTIGV